MAGAYFSVTPTHPTLPPTIHPLQTHTHTEGARGCFVTVSFKIETSIMEAETAQDSFKKYLKLIRFSSQSSQAKVQRSFSDKPKCEDEDSRTQTSCLEAETNPAA